MKMMEFNVFQNEENVISQAQEHLKSHKFKISATAYEALLNHYLKLFKTTQRLVKISDRFDEQLKNANTKIQRQQKELQHQNDILRENIKLREDVARITCHDLKNPLNTIINYPKLIAKDNLTAMEVELLEKISASGYKLLNMINLTLDLYKMEQGIYQLAPEPVNIINVLNDIFQELKGLILAKKISFRHRLNGSDLSENPVFLVRGEKLLLYSMLANLIKNALEASPNNATIVIDMQEAPIAEIAINNPGTVPEDIRKIFFEKYSTSGKRKGTGLGTYSAKLIMEAHGGTISMHSSEYEGTTLYVTFNNRF